MKWSIPAKTFFVGEYAAIAGKPAMLLTTTPCFELTLINDEQPGLYGIHPDSPAGKLWALKGLPHIALKWHDPYHGMGGLGASSAQWLAVWNVIHDFKKKPASQDEMLEAYFQSAWLGQGVRPSGYDVIAQSHHGCVYIHHQDNMYQEFTWPFTDLSFILLHTKHKLATHEHLNSLVLPAQIDLFTNIVQLAKSAFQSADSMKAIDAVNSYQKLLLTFNLTASHTQEMITSLRTEGDILAMKGCGAMGADVLLLLVAQKQLQVITQDLTTRGFHLLATSEQLLK